MYIWVPNDCTSDSCIWGLSSFLNESNAFPIAISAAYLASGPPGIKEAALL